MVLDSVGLFKFSKHVTGAMKNTHNLQWLRLCQVNDLVLTSDRPEKDGFLCKVRTFMSEMRIFR
jgi:hypothetical protein